MKHIDFSKTYIYWISKGSGRKYFTKQTLVSAMSFLINKSFPIGNMAFIIRIPMGFDPAPFWIKIFLSFFYLSKKVISNETFRRYKYHEVSRLIDNLCAINDRNQFLTSFKNMYSNEL